MRRPLPLLLLITGCAVAGVSYATGAPLADATRLPETAHQLRLDGVPEAEVAGALAAARGHDLTAGQANAALEAARDAEREHGPIDNLGAFVQSQLDAGKRGRDLADAIRAEHAKRGKKGKGGPPDGKGGPPDGKGGPPEGKGPDTSGGDGAPKGGGDAASKGRGEGGR